MKKTLPGIFLLLTLQTYVQAQQKSEKIGDGAHLIDIHGTDLFKSTLYHATYADGLICCQHEEDYGFLDANRNIVIPFKYRQASEFGKAPADNGFAYVTNMGGVSFYISKSGREYYSK